MKRQGAAKRGSKKKSPARAGNLPVRQVAAKAARAVRGGDTKAIQLSQTISFNKAKVANKAADAVDGYIRG